MIELWRPLKAVSAKSGYDYIHLESTELANALELVPRLARIAGVVQNLIDTHAFPFFRM